MALGVLLTLAPAGVARADDGGTAEEGRLRIGHLSPDTPAVDVTVGPPGPTGAGDRLPALAYGSLTEYATLPAGTWAVSVRAAGADPATPPVLSALVELGPGAARTVALTDRFAALRLTVLEDDLTSPPAGMARLRLLAAAGSAGAVDATVVGGPVLAADLPLGTAGEPVPVPAGPATLRVTTDQNSADENSADLPIVPAAGSVGTVLVLDRPGGGLDVRLVTDAAGPGTPPVGPVDAGGGGTAATGKALPGLGPTAGLAAVLLAGAAVGLAKGREGTPGARRRAVRRVGLTAVLVIAGALVPGHPRAPDPGATNAVAPRIALTGHPAPAVAPPVRLRLPAVGIDAALAAVDLDRAGTLAAPAADGVAGWLQSGPAPGEQGPAVLAGHVDSRSGPAVFFRLGEVPVGAELLVERADGSSARFTVTAVARYPKDGFPSATVYAPTTGPELRLITCGGAFDRAAGSYVDNVVVTARMVR